MARTRRYAASRRAQAQSRARFGDRTPRVRYTPARRSYVPRTMGPFSVSESKYFDTETNDFALVAGTAWGATNDVIKGLIAIPVEGSDIDNRIGRKIAIYKIAIRGCINHAIAVDQADSLILPLTRLILWQDKQTNATVTTSNLLMQAPTNAQSDCMFNSFQNIANLGRFRVLKDTWVKTPFSQSGTDGASTTSQAAASSPFKMVIKFRKPVIVNFNATNGGTIGDVVDNSFYLTAQKNFATYDSTLTCRTRCYYKDR